MQRFLRFFVSALLLVSIQSVYASGTTDETFPNFISITDLHFNPYDGCGRVSPCQQIDELRRAPVSEWKRILVKYQIKPNSYGADANYPLLRHALDKVANTVTDKTKFAVVLGDLISHDYDQNFNQYSSDKSEEAYKSFVIKSMQFVTSEINQALPNQDVFVALGNNDSDIGDNYYDSTHRFYKETGPVFGDLIRNSSVKIEMEKSFSTAGYYAVDVPKQYQLRLIVLNTILFAQKSQGEGIDQAARDELNWLEKELVNTSKNDAKALILMHIPAGIDIYASLKAVPNLPIELWKSEYTERFLDILHRNSTHITGLMSGHFHMDLFQVVTKANKNEHEIPLIGVPAISPIFGNNPAFKVVSYSSKTRTLKDYVTYYDSLKDQRGWQQEYDFNQVFQPDCVDCEIVKGMAQLPKTGFVAEQYQLFYSVGTGSQPITKSQKWLPYYWCEIKNITVNDYKNCVTSQ